MGGWGPQHDLGWKRNTFLPAALNQPDRWPEMGGGAGLHSPSWARCPALEKLRSWGSAAEQQLLQG